MTTLFFVGLIPTISTSSLSLTVPLSTLPVTTVPLPVIVRTSSIGIKNGLSFSLTGSGIYESHASINSRIAFSAAGSPSRAFLALPLITGTVSPGKPYFVNKSLTSISTKSINSGSSTKSVLFKKTTI